LKTTPGALSAGTADVHAAPVHVQKLDKFGRAYATGKRKNAVARVWIKPGKGKITVNTKDFAAYFARPVLQMLLKQPLIAAARADQYDVTVTVAGGGLSGQAGAVRHGISKALTYFEPDLRKVLKPGGILVYATCSLEREENEFVVEACGATVLRTMNRLPGRDPGDGFFAAALTVSGMPEG